jgi:short-subunit dehydrogenase
MRGKYRWNVVWITGASTGIGRELALFLARAGVTVAASARSEDKLAELEGLNANIKSYPLDVSDAARVTSLHAQIEQDLGPIDLAVLNAGIWQQMIVSDYSADRAKASMDVNYNGVVNALEPVMRTMVSRARGHIAIVASVAGYRGLMKGAAYAPTKAALIALCESLYPHLKRKGVSLTVISPGFVKTPMTDVNTFPMPFIIAVEDAAKIIATGLDRNKYEIVFPWRMALLMKTLRIMPNRLFFWVVGRAAERAGTGDKE